MMLQYIHLFLSSKLDLKSHFGDKLAVNISKHCFCLMIAFVASLKKPIFLTKTQLSFSKLMLPFSSNFVPFLMIFQIVKLSKMAAQNWGKSGKNNLLNLHSTHFSVRFSELNKPISVNRWITKL